MSRKIKFRVWNLKDKEFHNPAILEVWGNPIENYIIQQFTGLLDKNGKEIYEGDIVCGFDFIAEVIWETEDSAFQIRRIDKTHGGAFLNTMYMQNFEVIGNIFHNPELINK